MTLLRSLREALSVVLDIPSPKPSPLAVAVVRELVEARGVEPLRHVARRLDASVVDEFRAVLVVVALELMEAGMNEAARQVLELGVMVR